MDEIVYIDGSYCAICDLGFSTDEDRARHIQSSSKHPQCAPCNRRFLNGNSLRTHYVVSSRHHYCAVCEKMFSSAAGLKMHIEYAAVHRDDSDDDETDVEEPAEGWEDRLGPSEFPDADKQNSNLDDPEDVDDDFYDFEDTEALEASYPTEEELSVIAEKAEKLSLNPPPLPYTCPVCLALPTSYSATRCGHVFCTPCISSQLRADKTCPMCREYTTVRQLRKLYGIAEA